MSVPMIRLVFAVAAVSLVATGCNKTPPDRSAQKERAEQAKAQLFQALTSRLQSVASTDGFAAAVSVCAEEAPSIAKTVSGSSGVRIGRTSAKLRNPANVGPRWVARSLAGKPTGPTYVDLPDGELGALFPIRLMKLCENCHGPATDLAEPVRKALAEHYPQDQATGYRAGDLRGWFWVEVPADVRAQAIGPATTAATAPPTSLGAIEVQFRNARTFEGILVGGQPTPDELRVAAAAGVKTVVNLRTLAEPGVREETELAAELGLEYVSIPVDGAAGLTTAAAEQLDRAIAGASGRVMVHCASGNRVGALFAVRAHRLQRKSAEEALAIGKASGLTRLESSVRTLLLGGR